uniref:Predicted protein n=1 Tax=Hordeum vulgare subsp. vulgare TaxID=112509 RepID=F2D6D2_HORVV|nr:predicted protein [Hordeum vulgare subsp. vulgare]
MRRAQPPLPLPSQQQQQQQQGTTPAPGTVRVDKASPASSFRQLDDAFLQKQTKIWLGEVLHVRFDEDILVADLLGDGELLFQVSKVIWKRLLRKNKEQLKQSKVYIYERPSFGKNNGKYTPYPKVDSFLKVCQTLGLAGIDLFTPSDVVEKRNVRKVCMCIRSLSKKAGMMQLNVPDFDVVTHTIAMPNYIVGGIRRSLEQPQCSSSCSSGHSPRAISKSIFEGQSDEQGDRHYDSDEAESNLFVLEPQDSLDDDKLSELLQLGNAPKEEREGYGDSGLEMPEEKSLAESAGSLDAGVMDADTTNSTPFHENLLSPTDRCSTTRTNKCSLSSEESDSINSYLAADGSKNGLDGPHVKVSERIYDGHVEPSHDSVQGNGEVFADHPEKDDSASRELKHEFSTKDHMDSCKSDEQDTTENNRNARGTGNDAPKSGNGVLKSVAGGITLIGAVFFVAHLRRSKGISFTTILPSLSEKSIQSDSRAKNVDNGKTTEVYPGGWLKV